MSPEECEIRDWCLSLHCSVEELREAVRAVGRSADDIQDYLLAMRLRRGTSDAEEFPLDKAVSAISMGKLSKRRTRLRRHRVCGKGRSDR